MKMKISELLRFANYWDCIAILTITGRTNTPETARLTDIIHDHIKAHYPQRIENISDDITDYREVWSKL